jgi:hypothetical protein
MCNTPKMVAHMHSSRKAIYMLIYLAAFIKQAAAALSLTDCVSSASITIEYSTVYVVQEDSSVAQIAYAYGQNKTTLIDLGGTDKTALAVTSCDASTCILTGEIARHPS